MSGAGMTYTGLTERAILPALAWMGDWNPRWFEIEKVACSIAPAAIRLTCECVL